MGRSVSDATCINPTPAGLCNLKTPAGHLSRPRLAAITCHDGTVRQCQETGFVYTSAQVVLRGRQILRITTSARTSVGELLQVFVRHKGHERQFLARVVQLRPDRARRVFTMGVLVLARSGELPGQEGHRTASL